MDPEKLLNKLEALLKQSNVETAALDGVEQQLGHTLRALLPVTDDGDMVLTEIMMAPFTEDAHLMQIYSTMILEIGPGYEALKEMILDWNHTCPLGAFGIYREKRQFYHKYNYLIPVCSDEDDMAEEIIYLISLILRAIAVHYTDAIRLSGHN